MKSSHIPTSWNEAQRDALALALDALDHAEQGAQPHPMAQALTRLAHCYRAHGEPDVAAQCLRQALRWAALMGSADTQLDLLCELAETLLDACGPLSSTHEPDDEDVDTAERRLRERVRDHGYEASRLAPRATDPRWEAQVLLRVSRLLDRCGDHDDAAAMHSRAMTLIARHADLDTPKPGSAAHERRRVN